MLRDVFDAPPEWPDPEARSELGIAMLKPDAIERGLQGGLVGAMLRAGATIVRDRAVALTPRDVVECFLHPTESYSEFLCSGPVWMALVRADIAHETLYELKERLRTAYGTGGDRLKNLIHTTGQGNEYHMFLRRFFPELSAPAHANALDLDLRFAGVPAPGEVVRTLASLDRDSALVACCVTLTAGQHELAGPLRECAPFRLKLAAAVEVRPPGAERGTSLLVYLPPAALDARLVRELHQMPDVGGVLRRCAERGHPVAVDRFAFASHEVERYRAEVRRDADAADHQLPHYPVFRELGALVEAGVDGLTCYRPDLSLIETELRLDLARLHRVGVRGGSSGLVAPGHFSVSITCLEPTA